MEARAKESPSASNDDVVIREDPSSCKDASEKNEKKLDEDAPKSPIPRMLEYKPLVRYPTRLKQDKEDAQFKKFLNIFKKLHINIPLVEALSHIPKYAKFMKDFLTNKRKLEELEIVTLSWNCLQ